VLPNGSQRRRQRLRLSDDLVEGVEGLDLAHAPRSAAEPRSPAKGRWPVGAAGDVVFTGCGSPYYLARSAATVFRGVAGRRAVAFPASELMLFPDESLPEGSANLLVAISRSGETTETVEAVARFRRDGGPAVVITCRPESSLTAHASVVLAVPEAAERSLAQTRSFSAMLAAAQGLGFVLAGRPFSPALLRLPEAAAGVIDAARDPMRQIGEDRRFERVYFLGGGPLHGLACEAALKMKEMALTEAEAFHPLEFRHGPMAMVDRATLVVGLLSARALAHEAAVLSEMRALGATTLAIGPDVPAEAADHRVALPADLSDLERAPLYLPPVQLLAVHRAVRKGLDPDRPANLSAFVSLDADGRHRDGAAALAATGSAGSGRR
jgi:glucosamine--fructose-6-phosphate aminotransferase (isomerizing)